MAEVSPKSRLAVALLAGLVGTLGLHRFYIGRFRTGMAILILGIMGWALGIIGWRNIWLLVFGYLLLSAAAIWASLDFVKVLLGRMKDKDDKPITRC